MDPSAIDELDEDDNQADRAPPLLPKLARNNHPPPTRVSEAALVGDYDEERAKLGGLVEVGEIVYEVEKVVARKGGRGDRDGLFRDRWKGYTPEEDTWERESGLKEGAEEVGLTLTFISIPDSVLFPLSRGDRVSRRVGVGLI